jgi:Domain of unknown function (DUF4167)
MRSGPDQRSRGRFNANRPFRQQPRGPQNSQTFDSNGPDVRVRGTAHQIFERYIALAREAATAGDRIAAENCYQHAEHYFRINNAGRDRNSQEASRSSPPLGGATGVSGTGFGDEGINRVQSKTDDDYTDF